MDSSVRCAIFGLLVALLLAVDPSRVAAGGLGRAGDGLRGRDDDDRSAHESRRGKSKRRGTKRRRGSTRRDDDTDDGETDDTLDPATKEAIGFALTLPWRLPHWWLSARYPQMAGFAPYPYARGDDGFMRERTPRNRAGVPVAARLGLDASLHGATVGSGALDAQIDFEPPVALRTRWRLFGEPGAQPQGQRAPTRWAGIGEIDLLLRFAESPHLAFYSGLGYAQWSDAEGTVPGIAFHYGVQVYPLRPLSLGSDLSGGLLGQSYLLQWRSHVGLLTGRLEIRAGYAHIDVAGQSLGGPFVGLQMHL